MPRWTSVEGCPWATDTDTFLLVAETWRSRRARGPGDRSIESVRTGSRSRSPAEHSTNRPGAHPATRSAPAPSTPRCRSERVRFARSRPAGERPRRRGCCARPRLRQRPLCCSVPRSLYSSLRLRHRRRSATPCPACRRIGRPREVTDPTRRARRPRTLRLPRLHAAPWRTSAVGRRGCAVDASPVGTPRLERLSAPDADRERTRARRCVRTCGPDALGTRESERKVTPARARRSAGRSANGAGASAGNRSSRANRTSGSGAPNPRGAHSRSDPSSRTRWRAIASASAVLVLTAAAAVLEARFRFPPWSRRARRRASCQ